MKVEVEPIAIIGIGCRFPGAKNLEAFWQILQNGVDTITEVPSERWDIDTLYHPESATPGKMNTRWGGFLEQVDRFDPSFFRISPREAQQIDPQQRLLLEVTWEALENAGIAPESLAGSQTAAIVGISNTDYRRLVCKDLSRLEAYSGTGTNPSIAANRLSYFLNLRGPSLTIDTACSSSLVALHYACQSLQLRESNLCLVGGVNLILAPEPTIIFSQAGMLAADGRCKTFDASADGYVRGEGCGVVVLKRLSDAISDGDNVQAVIKGSAVNQDGLTNGITAPNGPSQQAVIHQALAKAGVTPAQISYVEAHGTGTFLGDPIEMKSLKTVLMEGRAGDRPCWIGSVKTNIGHLESAAGIAGLIKVVLSLQHQEIPPHLHLKQLNPYLKIKNTPIKISTELQPWQSLTEKRLAGVSSFGFGGTNAHVILEEAPTQKFHTEEFSGRSHHLLTLSAKCEQALQDLVQRYEEFLGNNSTAAIADICFTANTGRSHFNHRLTIITSDKQELVDKLAKISAKEETSDVFYRQLSSNHKPPKIAFLFTGQGSQYIKMGCQLYETQPTFRQAVDECAELMEPYLEQPLLSILDSEDRDRHLIHQTIYAQPTLFALEYALFRLWQSWGVVPDAVLGHSVGEYVAAVVAGVINLADGVRLVTARAKLMQNLPSTGEMVAVFAAPDEVQKVVIIDGRGLSFAVYNNPQNTVISGEILAITAACDALTTAGIGFKKLRTSHAFHSVLMEPILAEFRQVTAAISYHSPQIPLISNLTGRQISTNEIDAEYWCQHLRQTVKFADGLQTLDKLGVDIFLEIGPKPTLIGIAQQCLAASERIWLNSLRFGREDWVEMLDSLARLAVNGTKIDWAGFDRDYDRQRIPLPTYPFQRQSYWIDVSTENVVSTKNVPLAATHNHGNISVISQNLSRSSVEMTNQQRQQDILEQLHHTIAKLLKADPAKVDVNAPFLEMGADSLVLVGAIGYVERTFGIKIVIQQIFEKFTTITLLAEHIHDSPNLSSLGDFVRGQLVKATTPALECRQLLALDHLSNLQTKQPEPRNHRYPLSQGQWGLWVLYKLRPESAAYNVAFTTRICAEIDIAALKGALQSLIDRHPTLRTTYGQEDTQPFQEIHAAQALDFEQIDANRWDEETLTIQAIAAYQRPFDIESGSVLRVTLLTQSLQKHVLTIAMHHIAMDGISLGILLEELKLLYQAEVKGQPLCLPLIKYQYTDFVRSQQDLMNSAVGEKLWHYWQQRLATAPTILLPTDRPRPSIQRYCGGSISFEVTKEVTTQLRDLAKVEGVTLYILLLAVFQVLLHRYTGQEDLVVGTPTNGRTQTEFAQTVGFFVNMIALRSNLAGNPKFTQFLAQVRHTVLEAIAHQSYPDSLLIERLGIDRRQSLSGLFRASFNLLNLPKMASDVELSVSSHIGTSVEWGNLVLEPFVIPQQEGQNDLVLDVMEMNDRLVGTFRYSTDLFETATIERMAAHFQNLLSAIVENSQQSVGELPWLSEAERHQLIVEWNDTATEYPPTHKCIHQLFEEQVERTPNAVAVVFESEQLTYQQLNHRANQLAHHLQSLGVQPEVLVGICVERSIEMVVGLLGILKAGGAYVPLDPNYPQTRLSYMLSDAGVKVLLTQQKLLSALPVHFAQVICLDTDWAVIEPDNQENLVTEVSANNLAYVIYTSGSTGQPKGVAIEHQSLCNLAQAQRQLFEVKLTSRILQFASVSFDASVWEIFMAITAGARLIMATAEALMPGDDLKQILDRTSVTHVTLPPSALSGLPLDKLPFLGQIVVAGEACPIELAHQWSVGRRLFNAYGPTEATVCATVAQISEGCEKISIGKPLANTQIYILDRQMQPVPIGVAGELYIGGDGLARGYLNQPELTQAKFVPNPFLADKSARLYKTGDLARYLSDGNIEFLGRIDHQVKIRGFRIELGEIEALLSKHPHVKQTVVMAIEDIHQNKRLVAYVVSEDDDFSSQQLREFLQQQLPAYMVPSAFIILDTMPLTPNGKVDRKALPAPDGEIDRSREYVAPGTETEQILANIWQELLLVERVSIHDNFFELGGHSLLATSFIFRIRQTFAIDLPLRHLFEAPTIAALSPLIEQLRAEQILADLNNCLSREPVLSQQNHIPGTPLPLSLAQQYIWHMHQAGEPGAALNSTIAIRSRETLSPIVLEQSFNEIIRRHEVLRTVFTIVDDRPMQVVMPELHLPLFYEDLQHLPPDRRESAALSLVMNSIKRPFDLCAAPLIRVSCIRFAPEEYGLFIVAHHIITDGWSLGLLISELNTLIQAFSERKPSPLLPVDYQYTDFALWQQQVVSADSLTRQLTYWQHKLVEEVDPIESNSFSSSPLSSKRAGRHVANFPNVLASAVESFCRAKGVTPFVVLLAGLKLTLAKWSGRQEILVVNTIGNRTEPETQLMLGCFINDVIMRSHLSPTHTGLTLIQSLQATLNEAIENKDVPLHQVLERVQRLRPLTLMANITLTPSMQASDDLPSWEAINWYEQEYVADDHPIELCDKTTPLEFYVEISQTVRIVVHYSMEAFTPETIESLMTSYQDLLSQLVAQPETFLAEWIGSRFYSKK